MCVVVGRIDAPLRFRLMMIGVADAVQDRIAHVDVRRGHVDFRAQAQLSVPELPGAHTREQLEAFFRLAVAPGAVGSRLGQRAAILSGLFGAQLTDIGLALADQLPGKFVQVTEIRRGVAHFPVPAETEPADIVLDGVDELLALLERIGVVETKVAMSAVLLGKREIQADGLGVSDVKVAVGFRRKARMHAAAMLAGSKVPGNHLADESGRFGGAGRRCGIIV